MGTTGTLRVTRSAGHYQDALRAYHVLVDGVDRGTVAPGGQLDVLLPPGPHRVRASIDWTGSREIDIDVETGGVAVLQVEPAGSPLLALVHLFSRDRYLRLGPPPD